MNNIILHIPHSSKYIPKKLNRFTVNKKKINKEILKMTDLYTDDLFDFPYEKIIFPINRLICDGEYLKIKSKK